MILILLIQNIQTHHAPTKPRTHDTWDPWPSCCENVCLSKRNSISHPSVVESKITLEKNWRATSVVSQKHKNLRWFLRFSRMETPCHSQKKKHNLLDIQTPWGLVFEVCWKGSPVIPNLKRWLSLDVGWDRKFGWPTLKKSVAISGKKEGFDLCLARRVPLGSFGSPVTPEIFGLLRVDFW